MENIRICIIQSDIIWEEPEANLDKYRKMIDISGTADLYVLPEMFTTGFTMQSEKLKESMDGLSVSWMKNIAREYEAAVTGTLIIEDEGAVYNRCVWIFPDGKLEYYDKHHLFTMSGEHLYYSAGVNRLLVEYKGWKFFPLICYDLRFPVWSRNTQDYDVLVYMANWPAARHHVWKSLLTARAIENQAYCIGVNRVGEDGNGIKYNGDSALVSPKGIPSFMGNEEGSGIFNISYRELHEFRKKFPILDDMDEFDIS